VLKHGRTFLAWAVFVFVLAALALIGTHSSSYQKCAADYERDYAHDEQSNLYKGIAIRGKIAAILICEGAFIDENNGTLGALATIAIAAFTLTLWRATTEHGRLTREVLDLARAEFISSHRPRIIMRDVCEIWEGDAHNILYMLVNSGDAPGTIIESWILAESVKRERPIRNLRSYGHDELGQLTFAAGEMKDLTYPLPPGPNWHLVISSLPELPVGSVQHGAGYALYFTGAILYADDAGNRRRSVFRRRWDDESKAFVRVDDPDQEYAD
jgi:hypothetical protein